MAGRFRRIAGEAQAFYLASNGFRVVTHDRRGHGRSSQPWDGNDMDHYADDLADLIETLDLKDIFLAGFSTRRRVARYIGRHGTARVAKAGLISAVPPLMVNDRRQPRGLPKESSMACRPPASPIARSFTGTSPRARSSASTGPARNLHRA